MTETDPDAIGPDGTVRLRCYLPLENSLWFFAGCQGRKGCGLSAPISVRTAIRFTGSAKATVGELERRLRCSRCGNRQVGIVLQPDTRPPEVREREGGRGPSKRHWAQACREIAAEAAAARRGNLRCPTPPPRTLPSG